MSGDMLRQMLIASYSLIAARRAFGLAAVVLTGIAPAAAGDFTQDECKGIAVTSSQVVRIVGAQTLSREFRQSFMNWMGRDLKCAGPKDIIIMSENDSVTYSTIRSMLLAASHPLSLQKAGLRVIIRSDKQGGTNPLPQNHGSRDLTPR